MGIKLFVPSTSLKTGTQTYLALFVGSRIWNFSASNSNWVIRSVKSSLGAHQRFLLLIFPYLNPSVVSIINSILLQLLLKKSHTVAVKSRDFTRSDFLNNLYILDSSSIYYHLWSFWTEPYLQYPYLGRLLGSKNLQFAC